MMSDSELQQALRQVGELVTPPAAFEDAVMRRIERAVSAPREPGLLWAIRTSLTNRRTARIGIVGAAAAFVILGTAAILPLFTATRSGNGQWWLGSPAAWAGEIDAALAQAKIRGVTCRERFAIGTQDGRPRFSSTVTTFYLSRHSYRRDHYDNGKLREIQWYVPGKDGQILVGFRHDTRSFGAWPSGGHRDRDPLEQMRFWVKLLGKADLLLGTPTIDGHKCVGFEIAADKYGDNPKTTVKRIWFDVKTKLPVRTEVSFPSSGQLDKRITMVRDQFKYGEQLPPDTFVPRIPEGYVQAHPDDLRPKKRDPQLSDEQVHERLRRKANRLALKDVQLEKAVGILKDLAGVEIWVNWPVLNKLGIRKSTRVNRTLKDVRVDKALGAILGGLDRSEQIGYVVRNGMIAISRITSKETVLPPRSDALEAVTIGNHKMVQPAKEGKTIPRPATRPHAR